MRLAILALVLSLPVVAQAADRVWEARYGEDADGRRELALIAPVAGRVTAERSFPAYIAEHAPVGKERMVVVRAHDEASLRSLLRQRGVDTRAVDREARRGRSDHDEVVTLVDSGPSENRIDLVFMGDGYTAAERDRFFADIQRIVGDMFEGPTFHSYLPLFNVHAVFRPSAESGIGRNDVPKDTAYRLAREGETLRAIFPGDRAAIRASCRAAPGCDYPVVIANDPYYGGLGGEVAISTSSPTSGTVVLRHELGHNFGQVGEEYDGGGYFGANYAETLPSLGWRHWLTDGSEALAAEPAVARFLGWPWHHLSSGPYVVAFDSDGRYGSANINVSASGIGADNHWRVALDDQPLTFASPGHDDRTFYNLDFASGFAAGHHELTFADGDVDDNNWLSSLTVHEFGAGYHFDPDYIGAFPLFDEDGRVAGYRSNHDACLMRNMRSPRFCKVCIENNWHNFLAKLSLIDSVTVAPTRRPDGAATVHVLLATQRLPGLEVAWLRDGIEVDSLRGRSEWTLPADEARGDWRVEVRFRTPEIRDDRDGVTRGEERFRI